MTETGCYVYAVAQGLSSEDVDQIRGLRSAPVRVCEHRGLSAVVSTVDLEEFGDAGLRQNLESLTWLEEVARTHDEVIQAVARLTATAPLRLATICMDDDSVRSLLDKWHDPLGEALQRVEGRVEWSVKVLAPTTVPDPAEAADVQATGSGVGAAYLKRRKEAHTQRELAAAESENVAHDIYTALAAHTVAGRRLAAQDPRLSGHEGLMVLNAAYLVEADASESFQQLATDLAADYPSVRVDIQGPWPPYSFSTLDEL